jgi:signal peptidase I
MAVSPPGGSREEHEPEEKTGSPASRAREGESGPAIPARRAGGRGDWYAAALEVAVLFITALVLAIFLQAFFIKPFIIPSPSMEPTLQEGDRVLVDRLTYHFRKPRKGEVIVFRFNPTDPANATQGGNPLSRSLDLLAEVLFAL